MVKSWGELKDQHQIKNGENERNLVQKKRFKFLIMFLFGACKSYFSNPIYENITLILPGLYPKNRAYFLYLVGFITFARVVIYILRNDFTWNIYIAQKYERLQANLLVEVGFAFVCNKFTFSTFLPPSVTNVDCYTGGFV